MPKCTRNGCKKDFTDNPEGSCQYHPGAPVFHEGLKYWSCCEDTNKPVLDFESFMAMPGCATGVHTEDVPEKREVAPSAPTAPPPAKDSITLKPTEGKSDAETFSSGPLKPIVKAAPARSIAAQEPPPPPVEDEDDPALPAQAGQKCLRNGCKHIFVSDEVSRGNGEGSTCVYHPKPPIFHEGSKGYHCCKRRVLEFDEFLKIEGCKTGKHVFVKKKKTDEQKPEEEELVQCRIDHYQTPSQVHVSVFGKQADKQKSTVVFEEEQLHIDLYLPSSKRFTKTLTLFGPIQPDKCSYKVYGTKMEITLTKQGSTAWNLLEKTGADLGNFQLTFGVSGRTGTIGAKELVLDAENQTRA